MTSPAQLELPVDGMTCAACARRVEASLNGVDGATARVNFATELATISYDAERVSPAALGAAVRAAGYIPRPHVADADAAGTDRDGSAGARAAVALACAAPTVAIGMVPGASFAGSDWVALVLASVVTWWAAWPIHRGAARGALHRSLGMDALVSLGVLAAWTWSTAALLLESGADLYFESAAIVAAFVLAGRWLETRARRDSGAALRALRAYAVGEATLVDDLGNERTVRADSLVPGDRFVVRPGERLAADGVVDDGRSSIDQSLITGESVPVAIGPGSEVVGGTLNADGRLVVRATRTGNDTALATIGRLISGAQTSTVPAQRLADRVSAVFVPIVIGLALATFVSWLVAGADVGRALEVAIAVLVVACPCALGLATPLALLAGTLRGSRSGILVSGAAALEQSRHIDTIVLDKTGTLTTGEMSVDAIRVVGTSGDEHAALAFAAAVETSSEHPVARAIVRAAHDRGIAVSAVTEFTSVPGHGVSGTVDGRVVLVGRAALLEERGVVVDEVLRAMYDEEARLGRSLVLVAGDGAARAVISCSDSVRATSREAVDALRALGLRPHLVTGDGETVAASVAAQLGIDDVRAGVTPADKAALVRELQASGHRVAMVGDGINDAPALAQADLGIAMGSGTDVAIAASDITLLHADPLDAARAIKLSRRTLRTIRGNLAWAFAYNVGALPLAVAGVVNPMIAGAAMALSSLFVVGNSLRLRR